MKYDIHGNLHDGSGLSITLKRIGQYIYEKTHSREDFMSHTHKNYLIIPLTDDEKTRYGLDPEELDLNTMADIDKILSARV